MSSRFAVSCHRIGPGATNLIGPELNGVVGRKAGIGRRLPLLGRQQTSGVTWDEAT